MADTAHGGYSAGWFSTKLPQHMACWYEPPKFIRRMEVAVWRNLGTDGEKRDMTPVRNCGISAI